MKPRLAGAVACLLLLCGGAAWGDGHAWNMVWRSETATERTSVVGRVSTMFASDGRSLSATAQVSAAGGKTRLDYHTDRRSWSLIDDGKQLIDLDPRSKTARVHERPRLAVDRALAERNYTAKTAGRAIVAGRSTTVVEIAPQREGPAVLRLWIDDETGFALKRERHNVGGKLVSGTEYQQVAFGSAVSPDLFHLPAGWTTVRRTAGRGQELGLEDLGRRLGIAVRPPGYLPPGYVSRGAHEAEWGRWRMRAAELRYTDGIRTLSVFERGQARQGGGPRHRRGRGGREHRRGGRGRDEGGFGPPTQEMTLVDRGAEKALRYFGPSIVVIVVGDLAEDDLTRVARSVAQQ
jgi:outer membrane lipoprotein-sorting protein